MAKCNIKCSECEHCVGIRPVGNTRTEFSCKHPNQRYIYDYFMDNRISKMPGFLGFSAKHSNEVPIKGSPKWCPEKVDTNS